MTERDVTASEVQAELDRFRQESVIKDSMLLELSDALNDANWKVAQLNGQKKLRDHRIAHLEQQLNENPPDGPGGFPS